MNRTNIVTALVCAAALAGCTSGNTGVPPTQTSVNPITTNVLKFSVGTANLGGVAGLNTVVTYRQPNGLDGTLLNTPTIAGPAGFVNNGGAAAAGNDNGTNLISGSAQPLPAGTTAAPSTFGTSGGAFAYGFQPNNSTTAGGVSFARYSLPFFPPAGFTAVPYVGGPPAYQNVRDGTFPSGFQGYTLGFTSFGLTPVAGNYTLTLNVPTGFDTSGNPTSANVSAAAALTSLVLLPTIAPPVLVPTRGAPTVANPLGPLLGGATITVTIPPGITEAMIIVRDATGSCYPGANGAPVYYTFLTTTTGPQTFTLADRIGPTFGSQTSTPSLCPGDSYRVYAVGFDYDAFGAGPPGNRLQSPTINGAGGQSDVTQSKPAATATIPLT